MSVSNLFMNNSRNINQIYKIAIAQYSSEHRLKNNTLKKVGFETKPNASQINCDYIGPPDKLSNLRPVVRRVRKDETEIERRLRLKQLEVEEWNQRFWAKHNQNFFNEKQSFINANKVNEEDTLSADKMSEFYKSFLDRNWKTHFEYNHQWYKKNFEMLLLSYRTKFQWKRWF